MTSLRELMALQKSLTAAEQKKLKEASLRRSVKSTKKGEKIHELRPDMINEQGAVMLIMKELSSRDLLHKLRAQIATTLREARRSPFLTDKTTGDLKRKGNRHYLGYLRFYYFKNKAVYIVSDLYEWMLCHLIPFLERLPA